MHGVAFVPMVILAKARSPSCEWVDQRRRRLVLRVLSRFSATSCVQDGKAISERLAEDEIYFSSIVLHLSTMIDLVL